MTHPRLNDDHYFHLSVTEKAHSPHVIFLEIHEQTSKPDGPYVAFTKVADYDADTASVNPRHLIEEAINRLYFNTPQYFKGFEDPEHKFAQALSDIVYPDPQAKNPEPPAYPDFLDPDKMDDTTLTGLLSVFKNYCEILPNTTKNIRPPLSNAQFIAVLIVLERLSTADRLGPEMDDLYDALSIVLESARSGEYWDLTTNQWEAVEHYYALLAEKSGLTARTAEGEVITLPEHKDTRDPSA